METIPVPTRHVLSRVSPRVFYGYDCGPLGWPDPLGKELADWVQTRFKYDEDFRIETPGWPVSPPAFRLIFVREEDAEEMIAHFKDRPEFEFNPEVADNVWTFADPDRRHGW